VVATLRHNISFPDGSTARSSVFIVVKEFLVLNGIEAERATGPAGMGQYVVFVPTRGCRGEGGRNESHRAELLLNVSIVSVVASVKRVAWRLKHETGS
jgi:hypothetical protein